MFRIVLIVCFLMSTGVISAMGPFIAGLMGGSSQQGFPIVNDSLLGESYELDDWSLDCARGNMGVIRHFLDTPNYEPLLSVPDGTNCSLTWAAFGYINGTSSSIEGFCLLAEHESSNFQFLIKTSMGRMAFDQWLLLEAEYPQDAAKQVRLEALKTVTKNKISHSRLATLAGLQSQRDAAKVQKEVIDDLKRAKRNNRLMFGLGCSISMGLLWYFFGFKKSVDKAGEQAV